MMYAKFKFKQLYKVQLLMFKQFINGNDSYLGLQSSIIFGRKTPDHYLKNYSKENLDGRRSNVF